MDQVVIFKQIFDKVRNDLNYQWFYSELKRHNVSHYIYYLATENVHIVGNDSNLLIVFYVQIMPDDFVMQL
ncbi:TPA: DUF1398 family protein, partial [Escherichia coli]|nr:DUF1398 family protein [Escherichia coli]HCP5463858.1 DUF1398 family protein [Escherichia coli]HCP5472817.1 DUF1398 family protein [Escherichia coli]HCP5759016.1 DUF1398 family protein [Escherichia coli]HCP5763553.1 DUF1398 family protein [Escherichia coli]